ncbi:MAG: MFS transporter, partial [Bacteroidota bacterium]
VSNYFLFEVSDDAWRWMLGVQAVPSLLYFALVFFVPESPRWLVKQGKVSEAKAVMNSIGEPNADEAVANIQASLHQEAGSTKEKLFTAAYKQPIFYAVALAMFNQLAGINAIMYYAPRIFEMTGLAKDGALLQAVSIGVTNMVFTLLAISVIDKLGRKTLMIIGSIGMIFTLGMV